MLLGTVPGTERGYRYGRLGYVMKLRECDGNDNLFCDPKIGITVRHNPKFGKRLTLIQHCR
jgi:hypothetical protein